MNEENMDNVSDRVIFARKDHDSSLSKLSLIKICVWALNLYSVWTHRVVTYHFDYAIDRFDPWPQYSAINRSGI